MPIGPFVRKCFGPFEHLVAETYRRVFIDLDDYAKKIVDIIATPGRLYRGRRERVEFRNMPVQDVALAHPGAFDLIVLSDVLHHIPKTMRADILDAARRCLAPGGRILLRDWARAATPIHALCHFGDRWLTGDRVAYLTPIEALALVRSSLPGLEPVAEGRIRPWRNNYAITLQC